MKNKLGIFALTLSFVPSILIFIFLNLQQIFTYLRNTILREIFGFFPAMISITILVIAIIVSFIIGNIITIRALLLKEESKAYPILSLLVLYLGTIIFFFSSALIYNSNF